MMTEDMQLLREYAEKGSETAFRELVTRHLNLVYSVALRQTRDPHLAEEVAQVAFVILARKAGALSSKTIIPGWLCRTARYASAKALASQRRRRNREQEAYMQNVQTASAETPFWAEMEPVLETVLRELGQKDHDALIVRFFQGRSFKDTAAALGTTEAAAKMRVNRALEKLRGAFARRGVRVTAVVIAGALSAHSVHAAPAGLAASISTGVFASAQLAPSTFGLINTTLKYMAFKKATAGAVLGLALLAAGTGTFVLKQQHAKAAGAPGQIDGGGGYATPEATFDSMLAALGSGDPKRLAQLCTPEQANRMLGANASKTPEQLKAEGEQKLKEFANYTVASKEQISPDEIHLHIRTAPHDGAGRPGAREIVFRMRKLGGDWKFDGTTK